MKWTHEQLEALPEAAKKRNAHIFPHAVTPPPPAVKSGEMPPVETLIQDYIQLRSVFKVAEKYGVAGQSVHYHLRKQKGVLSRTAWTQQEEDILRDYYTKHQNSDAFSLQAISAMIQRPISAIALKASELGITHRKRPRRKRGKKAKSASAWSKMTKEQRRAAHPHPRGMLGKHHSQETKEKLSKRGLGRKMPRASKIAAMKTCLAKYGHAVAANATGRKASWKSHWLSLGGKRLFARSMWESNYARYLEWQKERKEILDWEHEPQTFWFEGLKRGCMSYKPDFRVTQWTGAVEYHEVKGWMDSRSRTTINRMRIYHPSVKLVVIDAVRYKALSRMLKHIVKGWGEAQEPKSQ